VNRKLEAQALLLKLNQAELLAIWSLAAGESLDELALRLEVDASCALEIRKMMKGKIGAGGDADAVRVAVCAGLLE
jgi:hypothetical protein